MSSVEITRKFSPIRAVMFWPSSSAKDPWTHHLVRLGMQEYVYGPLDVRESSATYAEHAKAVFDFVTMVSPTTEKDLVSYLRGSKKPPPPVASYWRVASKYYVTHVEELAIHKSAKASHHVLEATSFEDVRPSGVVDMADLRYSDDAVDYLHDISYRAFHDNPMRLYRHLVTYMKNAGEPSNLYVTSFLHSLVKSCRKTRSVHLNVMAKPLRRGSLCFGRMNKNIHQVLGLFTVRMCPWCYKPVNMATKKKSSAGGAHKSHLFTDEYTQELLYCTEKNHAGIVDFPLVSVSKGVFYVNELTWEINAGVSRVFTVDTSVPGVAKVQIVNKTTGTSVYTPVELRADCSDREDDPTCVLCI